MTPTAEAAGGRRAPGPKGHPIFGMLSAARRDPLRMCLDAAQFGDVVRFRAGPKIIHLVCDPAGANHVLAENNKNYGKRTRGYQKLRQILGDGLLTAEGELWMRQRRIAQPAFHRQRVAAFAETMVLEAERTAERWLSAGRSGPVDVAAEMMRLTLDVIGRTMLSHDVTQEADRVGSALTWLLRTANDRITRLFEPPAILPTPENRRFRSALRTLDAIVVGIIDERRRTGEDKGDLLSLLMAARDEETGAAMSDAQLRDEAMTIFLAGHETTANALSWTFYLLAQAPGVGRTLEAELLRELGGRSPTLADLPRLQFTRMVIDESLRLYPPAWIIARSANGDDEVGGFHIPAGTIVLVCPYLIHRHPRVWESPEGFDPERFTPERAAAIPKGAYLPFGGGPRQCIGSAFALLEAQLVLATLWQRFRLDLVPGHPVEPEPSVTLRPRHGLRMTLHARSRH